MSEPNDDWQGKFDDSPGLQRSTMNIYSSETTNKHSEIPGAFPDRENDFTFPSGPPPAEDDDEVTESKIRAFLDAKVSVYFNKSLINITKHMMRMKPSLFLC